MSGNPYRLGGEGGAAVERDAWYRTPVLRAEMKELMRRHDRAAIRDTLLWYALILAAGVLAYRSLGTGWTLPAFFLYGTIYAGPADSRWHEAGHGTAFRSHWMNLALYQAASFQAGRRPTVWRWSHARHHTDTMVRGRDPEIQAQLPIRPLALIADFIGLKLWPTEVVKAVRDACGHIGAEERDFIPDSEWPKVRRDGQIWTLSYAAILLLAILFRSWLPLLFVGLPSVYGGWLYNFFGLVQHAALPEGTRDHRLNSRTVLMNPVFRFLYWNMNYHVEHHMFPMVPYHALPRLHAAIRHNLPPPYASTWAAYREVLPALLRQWRDPAFHIRRPLPAGAD